MRRNLQYFAAAAVIMAVACSSCKGRYADATPNGETVEVNVAETATAADADTDGAVLQAVPEQNAPVVTEVSVVSEAADKK